MFPQKNIARKGLSNEILLSFYQPFKCWSHMYILDPNFVFSVPDDNAEGSVDILITKKLNNFFYSCEFHWFQAHMPPVKHLDII